MPTDDGAFVETRLAAKKNADEMGKWLPVLGDDTILIIGIAVVRYYYVVRIMDWRPRRWTPNLQTCSTGIYAAVQVAHCAKPGPPASIDVCCLRLHLQSRSTCRKFLHVHVPRMPSFSRLLRQLALSWVSY